MGLAVKALHTWLVRYRREDNAGLEDRSHQVHHHPWRIPAEAEELICELRRGHPKWGPRRLVFEMGRRGHQVTRSSVYRTLVRNGLIEPLLRHHPILGQLPGTVQISDGLVERGFGTGEPGPRFFDTRLFLAEVGEGALFFKFDGLFGFG